MYSKVHPVFVDGQVVGKAILHSGPAEAIKAATEAAFTISKTNHVQFCPFSDASHGGYNGRGGVSVVYRRQWLPDGWTSDQAGTHPDGDFCKRAWSYTRCIGIHALEAVGVLESLHAANKVIARDLQVLKDHDCTVTVKCTTDSREALRHIASRRVGQIPALPVELVKRIKQEMQMLHGHGIKVKVELHWCQRNNVPQLCIADQLAGMAKRGGHGYSKADRAHWVKSDLADEIESLITLPRSADKASQSKTSDPPSAPSAEPTQAVKRKFEDDEDAKESFTRAKLFHRDEETDYSGSETSMEALPGTPPIYTMPATGGIDPEIKLFSWDLTGDTPARFDVQRPLARMVVLATMDWRQERKMSFPTML